LGLRALVYALFGFQNRDWRFWRKILMIYPGFHSKSDEVKRGQIRPLPRRGSTDFGGACLAGGPGLPGPRFFGAPRISIRTFWAQNRDWRFWRKILMICPDFHSKSDELKRGQIRPPPRRGSTDFVGACLAGGLGLLDIRGAENRRGSRSGKSEENQNAKKKFQGGPHRLPGLFRDENAPFFWRPWYARGKNRPAEGSK
jgi:hypothetical protein